jgi:trk system potassium uptake protein TrkH
MSTPDAASESRDPTRPAATRVPRIGPPVRLAVDVRGSIGLVGRLMRYLSLAALFPAVLAIGYGEPPWPFLGALAIGFAVGFGMERLGGDIAGVSFREGYLVVSLTWLLAAFFGALPYLLSGVEQLANPVDALFESMSGFTTTGSSVLTDIEALDRSLAMWRQFTQWLGGMGIIVLAVAVLPRLRIGGRQLLEAEAPGPEMDSLGERIRQTAQHLWVLYVALTGALALILAVLGWSGVDDRMDLYGAVAHAFTTMPTGGFSTFTRSIEVFAPATQWVVVVFMVIAGVNFALMYRAFARRRPGLLVRDEELRLYLLLLAGAATILVAVLYGESIAGSHHALRHGVFQAVSVVTTTGYASVDFNGWTTLALITLVALMFIGGSAGSTAGSVKVIRHLLLFRTLRREVRLTVRPELVEPVRFNGSVVDERTLRAVIGFCLLYLGAFVAGAGVIAVDTALQGPHLSQIDTIAVAATTLGNVGPALGPAGPMDSFAPFSEVSKLVMIVLMWLGRLEIVPVLILLSHRYWRV